MDELKTMLGERGGAVTGRPWRRGVRREELLDPRACQDGMRAISAGRLGDFEICGMCIAACPWTLAHLEREGAL